MSADVRVQQALCGERAIETLDLDEAETYFDLITYMGASPQAILYFERMRKNGGGVGCDAAGNLVKGLPGGEVVIIRPASDTE